MNILRGEKGAAMVDELEDLQRQELNGREWYAVEVEGQFHPGWFSWLDGWEILPLPNGNTQLAGPVIDQPALHGLFARIRDMNLKMISLEKRDQPPSDEI